MSPDGDEGYPGALDVTVTYSLTDDALVIAYSATTDRPTIINLTNHAYWNLGGTSEADILGHTLSMNADHYTVVDGSSIPTGELRPVAGTPFDFRAAKPISRDIAALKDTPGGGFDHNWVVARTARGLVLAAELTHAASGRVMRVESDQPGIQFYSGNYIHEVAGHRPQPYKKYAGLCLETQHFPDAPNHPGFASTVLRPGETYATTTTYRFSTTKEPCVAPRRHYLHFIQEGAGVPCKCSLSAEYQVRFQPEHRVHSIHPQSPQVAFARSVLGIVALSADDHTGVVCALQWPSEFQRLRHRDRSGCGRRRRRHRLLV